MRNRNLKLPRARLPEPLANCLRLYGFNWRGARSVNGKLWSVYRYGKPAKPPYVFQLHSDTPVEEVLSWCQAYERKNGTATYRIGEHPYEY